jgi:hypothetical protein
VEHTTLFMKTPNFVPLYGILMDRISEGFAEVVPSQQVDRGAPREVTAIVLNCLSANRERHSD